MDNKTYSPKTTYKVMKRMGDGQLWRPVSEDYLIFSKAIRKLEELYDGNVDGWTIIEKTETAFTPSEVGL